MATDTVDKRVQTNQIIYLSANPDGVVSYSDPSSHVDNGVRIDSRYQTGYYEQPGVSQLGGVGLNVRGSGEVQVRMFKDELTVQPLNRALQVDTSIKAAVIKATGLSPWWSIEVSNGATPGDWFELSSMSLFVRQIFKTRRPQR